MLATAVAAVATYASVVPCGGDMTDVVVQLYPETLTVGKDAYLYLSYSAPYEVASGTTVSTLNFNGIPYPDMDGKLCSNTAPRYEPVSEYPIASNILLDNDYYELGEVDCPITVGVHSSNESFSVPNAAGQLKSKIQWFSETGSLLLCLKFIITIEAGAAAAEAEA